MKTMQHFLCLCRKICQRAAFDRFHDNDFLPMLYSCLIAFSRLYLCILPVQIIQLQLYKLSLRVVSQDLIEHICAVME